MVLADVQEAKEIAEDLFEEAKGHYLLTERYIIKENPPWAERLSIISGMEAYMRQYPARRNLEGVSISGAYPSFQATFTARDGTYRLCFSCEDEEMPHLKRASPWRIFNVSIHFISKYTPV